jgi:hypothetical protein
MPAVGRYRKDCPDTISEAWDNAFATLSGDAAGTLQFPF